MWLVYALGGGWGHLNRAAAFARAANRPVRILTSSPYASYFGEGGDVVLIDPAMALDDARRKVLKEIARAKPSILIVDTFARGLGGELAAHRGQERRVLVQRDVAPKYAAQVREFAAGFYHLAIAPGEGAAPLKTAPWLIRDRFDPAPREGAIVVAGGNADEQFWYGGVTSALQRRGVRVRCVAPELPPGCPRECWVRHWPAMDLIAQARVAIGGGGYNTVYECAALNVPLVARPWPRKYDRQWLRARRAAARAKTVEEAAAAALALLDRDLPPPRFEFANGAREAAGLLLSHLAR